MSGSFLSRFEGFDAYAKTLEDFRVKTSGGGLITLAATISIIILLISEFSVYQTVEMRPELVIDKARKQKLAINMNITFPRVPCYLLSIDVMDVAGQHQDDLSHDVFKTRLDPFGVKIDTEREKKLGDQSAGALASNGTVSIPTCGSCYGGIPPEGGCCDTCAQVKESYRRRGWSFNNAETIEQCVREGWSEKIKTQSEEGCNIHGRLDLNKVAGNFHIAPGSSFSQGNVHVHDYQPYAHAKFDFSHEIHHLSFGERFDGALDPLDGLIKVTTEANHLFQYYVKVVGTTLRYRNGRSLRTNQYSVTQYEKPNMQGGKMQLPGFFLNYEISPLMVIYTEHQHSISHFLTGVCSIVGGIFTVAGLVDGIIYKAEKRFRKKMEIGKGH